MVTTPRDYRKPHFSPVLYYPTITPRSHTLGECKWAYTFFAAVLIIFSIQFSPILNRILSNRVLVFYGGISFPLYLIHGFMMRSLLSWVVFGLLDQTSAMRIVFNPIAFALWISLVTYMAAKWRDLVGGKTMEFALWLEGVTLGEKP